jgi:hypothetical protein
MKQETDYYFPNRYAKTRPFVIKLYNEVWHLLGKNESKASILIDEILKKEITRKVKEIGRFWQLRQIFDDRYDNEFFSFKTYLLWKSHGMNIFSFSKELLDLLAYTDVDDVKYQDLKYPFQNFYISFRELDAKIDNTFYNLENGLDGVYLEFYDLAQEGRAWISISICGFHKGNSDQQINNWIDNPEYQMRFGLAFENKNTSIKEAIQYLIKEIEKSPEVDDITLLETVAFFKSYLNLIVNCLCYLSLSDRKIVKELPSNLPNHLKDKIIKSRTRRKKEIAEKYVEQNNYSFINFVGEEFRKSDSNEDSGIELSPHFRRGHFRRHRHGVELKEIKILWIRPTIVRADKGNPTYGHIYNVDKE